jgi:cobalt-zinc-cadmium resistance protein CzcA
MRFNELIAGAKQDVVCKIFGEDLDTLAFYAAQYEEVIHKVEGAKDVFTERVTGLPQIVIKYKPNAIAAYGLSIADVNRVLRASFAGESAGQVYENERRFDLVLRLKENRRNDLTDIKTLMITNPDGISVPLEQVAEIGIQEGPNQVQREDAKRRITVAFNVRDRDVQSVVEEVQSKAEKTIALPAGYYVKYGGQFENLVEAKDRLMIAVPIALLLILLILYFSFGSLRYGLLIYTAIPLSAIGGILLLWMRDMPFSISAGVGFIALFGVAVLNGIVLINEFNRLKNETQMNMKDLVLKGTATRLRPVLMTAAVASLGFLPMALSTSSGAEVQRPLATVVIGGLISATLLTLFVLPVLYVWVEKRKGSINAPSLTLLLGFFSLAASSQTIESPLGGHVPNIRPAASLPLDSIIAMADRNALSLKMAQKQVEYYAGLKKKSTEIPKTSFGAEYGNINSASKDTRFFLNQQFQLPKVYARQKEAYQKAEGLQEAKKYLEQAELHHTIRQLCYRIMDLDRRDEILYRFLRVFSEWQKKAEAQQKAGDINGATLNAIVLQTKQYLFQKKQLEADRYSLIQELNGMIMSGNSYTPSLENAVDKNIPALIASLENHPSIQMAEAQIKEQVAQTALEKNRLAADFNLGYSNLSITGWQTPDGVAQKYYAPSHRFGIVQAGVSIPIFNGAAKAKINAAKVKEDIASMQKQQQLENLNRRMTDVISQFQAAKEAYDYYQSTGLKLSIELWQQARKRLELGDISYADYTVLLSQHLQDLISHAASIHQLQMASAMFQFLTEKK